MKIYHSRKNFSYTYEKRENFQKKKNTTKVVESLNLKGKGECFLVNSIKSFLFNSSSITEYNFVNDVEYQKGFGGARSMIGGRLHAIEYDDKGNTASSGVYSFSTN